MLPLPGKSSPFGSGSSGLEIGPIIRIDDLRRHRDSGLGALFGNPTQELRNAVDLVVVLAVRESEQLGPKGFQSGSHLGEARGSKTRRSPQTARPGTKQALLIDLLSRRKGATIAEAILVRDDRPSGS